MLPELNDLNTFRDALRNAPGPDEAARQGAADRNGQLTKPPGALGRREDLAIWYSGWRGDPRPQILRPQVIIFAGNHGVTAQGVSAFPAEVTAQMVLNFEHGGAAINQIARSTGARLDTVSVLASPVGPGISIRDRSTCPASASAFCNAPISLAPSQAPGSPPSARGKNRVR